MRLVLCLTPRAKSDRTMSPVAQGAQSRLPTTAEGDRPPLHGDLSPLLVEHRKGPAYQVGTVLVRGDRHALLGHALPLPAVGPAETSWITRSIMLVSGEN
jgi:hypothetical protein